MSKITVTEKQINDIMLSSNIHIQTVLNKTTIVTAELPNGFIIVESSSCVDPANYDERMGADICLARIANKVWELEGYRLQQKVYEDSTKGSPELPEDYATLNPNE